jgi:hypothetical protein
MVRSATDITNNFDKAMADLPTVDDTRRHHEFFIWSWGSD